MKFVLLIMLGLLFLIVAVITWDHNITIFELRMLAAYFILAGIVCLVYAHKGKKKPLTSSYSEGSQDCTACQKQKKEKNEIIGQTASAMSREKIDLDKMIEEIMNST